MGYVNVDDVLERMIQALPTDIPYRSMVQFKIENMDNGKVVVYERMKGKGC